METQCEIVKSKRGADKLCVRGYTYVLNKRVDSRHYWKCEKRISNNCKATLTTEVIHTLYILVLLQNFTSTSNIDLIHL